MEFEIEDLHCVSPVYFRLLELPKTIRVGILDNIDSPIPIPTDSPVHIILNNIKTTYRVEEETAAINIEDDFISYELPNDITLGLYKLIMYITIDNKKFLFYKGNIHINE